MQDKYMRARSEREETRTIAGRIRGGKLVPIMAQPFLGNEGGIVRQAISVELDPIAGRLLTEITMQVHSVFVPLLAIEVTKDPDNEYSGNTELMREKLLSASPVFGLEDETSLSKHMNIVPQSINGEKRVGEASRFAAIAATNYLRRLLYVNAHQLPNTRTSVSPALLGSTVLSRFNAVLNPEERVNGEVSIEGSIPVKGIGKVYRADTNNSGNETDLSVLEAGGAPHAQTFDKSSMVGTGNARQQFAVRTDDFGRPEIVGDFTDGGATMSIDQLYTAERMDAITRELRQIVDDNPEYGEDMISRIAHGLYVDSGRQPFLLYEREHVLQNALQRAMDGENLDVTQSNVGGAMEFAVPVPASEFGGIVITFLSVKPDETLASQPHPILSDVWSGRNHLADEMAIDPVPVTIRQLNSECAASEENQIAFYTSNNEMYRSYRHHGWSRALDTSTVAAKSAIWQVEVPLSVTPGSVIYENDLPHYPFADQEADVVQYTITNNSIVQTPLIYGPPVIEELAVLEEDDIFEENEDA